MGLEQSKTRVECLIGLYNAEIEALQRGDFMARDTDDIIYRARRFFAIPDGCWVCDLYPLEYLLDLYNRPEPEPMEPAKKRAIKARDRRLCKTLIYRLEWTELRDRDVVHE